ncbi:MAG: hypothetical protein WC292_02070 [Clostridia bacterium]
MLQSKPYTHQAPTKQRKVTTTKCAAIKTVQRSILIVRRLVTVSKYATIKKPYTHQVPTKQRKVTITKYATIKTTCCQLCIWGQVANGR